MTDDRHKFIVLVGGGSAGPVAPLLALAETLRELEPQIQLLFVGTKKGPERALADGARIPFVHIIAGKLRRYWSLANFVSPFLVLAGFFQALWLLIKQRPVCCVGAGGFVQVPLLWAAWVLRIPVIIHQQDIVPTLANTLCSPIAQKITTTFETSVKDFSQGLGIYKHGQMNKIVWTGNPVRVSLAQSSRAQGVVRFGLDTAMPTILVFGGGTGAQGINALVAEAIVDISKFAQVVHIVGTGKALPIQAPHYHQLEFTTDMTSLYAAADLVIARAGLSTMSELAFLGKPAIIIPMPDSHQEDNAALLWERQAAVVLDQQSLDVKEFVRTVRTLLIDQHKRQRLIENIRKLMPADASLKMAHVVLDLIGHASK